MAVQPNFLDILKSKIDPVREQGTKIYSEFREAARKNDSTVANILRDFHTFVSSSKKQDSDTNDNVTQLENKISNLSKNQDNISTQLENLIKQQQELSFKLQKIIKILDIDPSEETVGKKFLSHLKTLFEDKREGNSNLIAAGLGVALIGAQAMRGGGGGGGSGPNTQPPGTPKAESGSATEALQFFISKGWSKEQAAGIVGNLQAESNFKTDAVGDNGKAYGIAQWHPDRQQIFERQYGKSIKEASFKEQLEFVDWELNNNEKKAGNAIRNAKTAEEAASLTDQLYERSSGEHRQKRIDFAKSLVGDNNNQQQSSQTQAPGPGPTGQQGATSPEGKQSSVPSFGASTPGVNPQSNITPSVDLTSVRSKSGKSAQVDAKSAPQFQGFINDLENTGYKIETLGGYANRQNVNDPTKKSVHAYGMAIDINSENNPNRSTKTDLPPETNQLAQKWGLGWGMNWSSVKDPMHFSTDKDEGGTMGKTATENTRPSQQSQQQASAPAPMPAMSPSEALREAGMEGGTLQNAMSQAFGPTQQQSPTPFSQQQPFQQNMMMRGATTNLIATILNSVIGNRLPGNMLRDTRPTQIENAAISSLIQPANRNEFVRNLQQQPNLDPNDQRSNAFINEGQSGMDSRLSKFLQVNNTNWTSSLASYYGLQQETGVAYNATG
jgi:hypothetical protein